MTAFIVGAMAARILPQRTTSVKAYQQTVSAEIFSRLGWRMLTIGIVSSFGVSPVSALVPSLTAITSVLGSLLILGFWVQLAVAATTNSSRRTLLILATLPLLPLSTLVTGGFIGFGTVWALSVVSFLFVIARRRLWFYLATPPVIFLGLSLFVTYAQQRDDIRDVIWYQDAGIMRATGAGLHAGYRFSTPRPVQRIASQRARSEAEPKLPGWRGGYAASGG